MTTDIITRQQMVDWMEVNGNASVTERLGHNWQRLNTSVADQGNLEKNGCLNFHLLELCLKGQMNVHYEGTMEHGDEVRTDVLAGGLQYAPSYDSLTFVVEGQYTIQQIYIDDAVFRETAQVLAPGDPDNLKPLGFQGIFEPKLKRVALQILEEARNPSAGGELYADLLA